MVAVGALATSCNAPEQENVTITGTDGPINATVTGPGGNSDGAGVDETAEAEQPDFPGDPFTFHIEETTQFMNVPDVFGCNNDDLNSVGGALWAAMLGDGWTGQYLLNGEGTPYDFMDPSPGLPSPFGQEGTTSDSRRVTVIASHGNVNRLQWGQPGATPAGAEPDCQIRITESMRLGTLVGDVSGAAIYATSCTAYTLNNSLRDTLGVGAEIGQHFGWHNSPYISDGLLASFFEQTGTSIIDGDDGPYPVHNLEVIDAGVRIGIHRDGDVSSIRLTDVEITAVPASPSDVVSMTAARESLIAAERMEHPEASLIIEHERFGVLLGPGQHTVISPPSMVFNYSLRFGNGPETTVVSRQKIAMISLFSGKYAQVYPVPATVGE